MDRKELEAKGLNGEQIEYIMAEYGKAIQLEQAKHKQALSDAVKKAVEPLNSQITELTKQNGELNEAIKASAGVDEKAKGEIETLNKTHEKAIKELTAKHEADLAAMRRESDTKDFYNNLGKKFANQETRRDFERRMNEALMDKANEGKNRHDIHTILAMGEDGNERTDIYAPSDTTRPPNATGATNPPPKELAGAANAIPIIL